MLLRRPAKALTAHLLELYPAGETRVADNTLRSETDSRGWRVTGADMWRPKLS